VARTELTPAAILRHIHSSDPHELTDDIWGLLRKYLVYTNSWMFFMDYTCVAGVSAGIWFEGLHCRHRSAR
jgi:hypothetical protein